MASSRRRRNEAFDVLAFEGVEIGDEQVAIGGRGLARGGVAVDGFQGRAGPSEGAVDAVHAGL